MDWTAKIETDRNVLERIVAILFALAELAERAAGRSWPVRRLVLSILHRAEDAAHAFVTGSAVGADLELSPPYGGMPALTMPRRDGPADALRLAMSFRTLALAVRAMLPRARRSSRGRFGRDASRIAACAQAAGRSEPDAACFPQERQASVLSRLAYKVWPDTS